jgi:hypothetical protein
MTHKILRAAYYWPTIFFDTHKYVKSCRLCQFFLGKQLLPALPLKPVVIEASFQQRELDFVREFKENSSNRYRWFLNTTDYFTQ